VFGEELVLARISAKGEVVEGIFVGFEANVLKGM
jgi:hypothetical protein